MKDGGPAFPCHPGIDNPMYDGMTLRDYLAAKAMQHMAMPTTGKFDLNGTWKMDEVTVEVLDSMSRLSYKWADCMLKAREE